MAISDVSCLEPCCEIDAAVDKTCNMLSHTYKNGLHDDQQYDNYETKSLNAQLSLTKYSSCKHSKQHTYNNKLLH